MLADWYCVAAATVLATATGCSGVLGLDDFAPAGGEGGGASAATGSTTGGEATTSATGGDGGGAGDGGAGSGGAPGAGGSGGAAGAPCDDEGEVEVCYDGPSETVGIGECSAGSRTCQGGVWSSCGGQVLPAEEDLGTWSDESCSPGDAEVRTFVHYAGENDDYIGGVGWPLGGGAAADDAMVAVGTFGELTVGGLTVSTEVDAGTLLLRHRLDGSIVWGRALSTVAPSGLVGGSGYGLLYGYAAEPTVVDGLTLTDTFVALVDGEGTFRAVLPETGDVSMGEEVHGLIGAYGVRFNTREVRRYEVDLARGTLAASTILDFAPHVPRAVTRNGGAAAYLVVGGVMNGTLSFGPCTATTGAGTGFIAVFSGVAQPTCESVVTLAGTGTSTVTALAAVADRLYVTGTFSGTLLDEDGVALVSEGTSSAFVARMTLAGGQPSLVWLRAFGGTGAVSGNDVIPNPSGGVEWTLGIPVGGSADVAGVELDPYQALVSFDAAGEVRFVRHLGVRTSGAFRRSGDALLAVGDLGEDAAPLGIDPPPVPGGASDAYFAVLEAP